MMSEPPPNRAPGLGMPVLLIVVAELLCTSLWFSANGVTESLPASWGLDPRDIGWLTNATQLGFIAGTLGLAITRHADRHPASKIFFASSLAGAAANAGFALAADGLPSAMAFRFLTGMALAGIYPIGMKLILSWNRQHSGLALALLVGMLTLGTALPHGLRALGTAWPWQAIVLASSGLALVGGAAVYWLADGPLLHIGQGPRRAFSWRHALAAFRAPDFRAAAFGYFGHMWELYAFWTIAPLLLYAVLGDAAPPAAVSGYSFLIIAVGALGSLAGGLLAERVGSARVAFTALSISGAMCALFPFLAAASPWLVVAALAVWATAVVADSPQFSSLSAQACPQDSVGSALAIQNGIGFSLTLLAIFLATSLYSSLEARVSWLLLPGPLFGLYAMRRLVFERPATHAP